MKKDLERVELVKKMKQDGMTYAEIGRLLNISRQRVYQLIVGKTHNKKTRDEILICSKCKRKVTRLEKHHPDYRSNNTISLCVKCHQEAHFTSNDEIREKFQREDAQKNTNS
jgi:DNA-binding transcriptional MerR regulator